MRTDTQPTYRTTVIAIAAIIAFAVIGYVVWSMWLAPEEVETPTDVMCTADAMKCPDGSYVGRTGPNCEFLCPTTTPTTTNDVAMTSVLFDGNILLSYPSDPTTMYVTTVEWPPEIRVQTAPYTCTITTDDTVMSTQSEVRLDGKPVCKSVQREGAAGSTFTSYRYTVAIDERLVTYAFTLRTVRCENYDMPKQQACQVDQDAFDVDALVSDMISSIEQVK
jgi:hypothetical protein